MSSGLVFVAKQYQKIKNKSEFEQRSENFLQKNVFPRSRPFLGFGFGALLFLSYSCMMGISRGFTRETK